MGGNSTHRFADSLQCNDGDVRVEGGQGNQTEEGETGHGQHFLHGWNGLFFTGNGCSSCCSSLQESEPHNSRRSPNDFFICRIGKLTLGRDLVIRSIHESFDVDDVGHEGGEDEDDSVRDEDEKTVDNLEKIASSIFFLSSMGRPLFSFHIRNAKQLPGIRCIFWLDICLGISRWTSRQRWMRTTRAQSAPRWWEGRWGRREGGLLTTKRHTFILNGHHGRLIKLSWLLYWDGIVSEAFSRWVFAAHA